MKVRVKYNDPQAYRIHFNEPDIHKGHIRITHSTRQAITIPVEEFTQYFIISHENFAIVLPDDSEITLDENTHHGKPGFRGCRYINGLWDSRYLFFPKITDVLELAGAPNQEERLNEAHLLS